MHKLSNRQLVSVGVAVLVIGGLLMLLTLSLSNNLQRTGTNSAATGVRVPPPQPLMTASDTVAALQGDDFKLLVSYVDSGFEPRTAIVYAGDTVRFTNNSTGQLWIASVGTGGQDSYPGTSSCGGTALDTCGALAPGQTWEFTFNARGTWEFVNNLDKSNIGVIKVQ